MGKEESSCDAGNSSTFMQWKSIVVVVVVVLFSRHCKRSVCCCCYVFTQHTTALLSISDGSFCSRAHPIVYASCTQRAIPLVKASPVGLSGEVVWYGMVWYGMVVLCSTKKYSVFQPFRISGGREISCRQGKAID